MGTGSDDGHAKGAGGVGDLGARELFSDVV